MLEGTREFKRKTAARIDVDAAKNSPTVPKPPEDPRAARSPTEFPKSDAVNLDRRGWFRSLVPLAGDGLVKILRASNNLKRDLHETLHDEARGIFSDDKKPGQD